MLYQDRSPCGWETLREESVWASDEIDRWLRVEMTYGLDVVADLLCDQLGDVLDEGIFDADLIAV